MIEEYFGLSTAPFRLGTDSRFFFQSDRHKKAMAYLQYGLQQGEGFVVITGGAGVGKSMIVDQFLSVVENMDVVPFVVSTSHIEPGTMINHVLSALQIEPAGRGYAAAHEALEGYLIDQRGYGNQAIMILDEAQNLSRGVLEEVRVLTNMVHEGTSLLQVFLAGQDELRATLQDSDMEHLNQRIIASCHLNPLSKEDTALYIDHRMDVAGWEDEHSAFSNAAMDIIFQYTEGVPRRINTFCSRVLLHTAVEKKEFVDSEAVKTVIEDLRAENDLNYENVDILSSVTENADGADVSVEDTEGTDGQIFFDNIEEIDSSALPHFEMEKPWMPEGSVLEKQPFTTENDIPFQEEPPIELASVLPEAENGDVVVPFKSPAEMPPFAVPRKLTAENMPIPEQKKLQQISSKIYENAAQEDVLDDIKAEIEAHTSIAPQYESAKAIDESNLERLDGESVVMEESTRDLAGNTDLQGKEEIEKIKSVLAAFVAETQDTLLEVGESIQAVKTMTAELEEGLKSQANLISDGLKDVYEELQSISNR